MIVSVLEVSIERRCKELQKGINTDSFVVSVKGGSKKEGTREESRIQERFSLCEVVIFCSDHNHVLSGYQPFSSPFSLK